MTEHPREDISRQMHDAAASWWSRRQANEPGIGPKLDAWLAIDPRHRKAFDQLERGWQDVDQLADRPIGRDRRLPRAPFHLRESTHRGAFVICALVVVGTLGTVALSRNSPLSIVSSARATSYRTHVGEIRDFTLTDGSRLTLDTDTQVLIRHDTRLIRIEMRSGRARLHSVHAETAVTVASERGMANVKGRTFDISMIGHEAMITAVGSPAEMRLDGALVRLRAGEGVNLGAAALNPHAVPAGDLRWVSGMIVLDAVPLDEAIAAINRYNAVQISIGAPDVAAKRVTGAFRASSPAAFAQTVAAMFDLHLEQPKPNELRLMP
jgi:transmembrane sensor